MIFVATKPPVVSKVAAEIAPIISKEQHLIVSIAMGIPIRNLEAVWLHLYEYFFFTALIVHMEAF